MYEDIYLVDIEGDMAVGESLFKFISKLIQRTDGADVADHGDVLVPVAALVVELESPAGEGDVEVTETVLDLAVHQVGVVPVEELEVGGVGLHLCGDTCKEILSHQEFSLE